VSHARSAAVASSRAVAIALVFRVAFAVPALVSLALVTTVWVALHACDPKILGRSRLGTSSYDSAKLVTSVLFEPQPPPQTDRPCERITADRAGQNLPEIYKK
jgi:hypothetical protein